MADDNNIKFSRLRVRGWRQFGEIDIELHPQLTVITGANGAGKSTLLSIFSRHFGYSRQYLSTPRIGDSGRYSYATGIISYFKSLFGKPRHDDYVSVGELVYSNGNEATAMVPARGGNIEYDLNFDGGQQVQGFHVSSHRQLPRYQAVGQIPTRPMLPEEAYSSFSGEIIQSWQGGRTNFSPTYRIKEALLSMAVLGPKTIYNQGNAILTKTFDGFTETLRKILPEEIGFLELSIRSPDVVLVTKTGDFLVDAASGGLMALIDLAWQIYMFSIGKSSFVVTIDEPENHLHPSMQRTLMGNMIKAFPNVQFIVATHSPFIVSALRDARVYVLRHAEVSEAKEGSDVTSQQTRFVSSVRLDSVNRAGSASQILRDVLGLPTTYPEWVSRGVEEIIEKYRGRAFDAELLKAIRKDLSDGGYGELYPDVASALAKS